MKGKYWTGLVSVIIGIGGVYLLCQSKTIYGGDAGDLASAIVTKGVAHPPGYPLYTSLGIIFAEFIKNGTAAWKIGFLSSLSSLLSAVILFDIFYFLTKKIVPSLLTVFIFAFLYPVWLYSEVVEVFALNNLFTVLLLWLAFRLYSQKKRKYLFAAFFILGLSLTHHHIIVFLIPTLFYLMWRGRIKVTFGNTAKGVLLFFLGFIPYFYVIISSFYNPPVNWQGAPTFANFFALITRAGYGTFQAGSFVGHQPVLRLINIYGFLDFVYRDFRILGLILIILGIVFLYKLNRTVWIAVGIGIISYLFFLFYASFPLSENFMLGTFERFVQPLYILLSFYLLFGIVGFEKILFRVFMYISKPYKARTFAQLGLFLVSIYPAGLFILNYPKINSLKNDFTAENLGRDILNSVPKDAVLIISTDTPLFNTQYVYYTEKKWPEVKLIHLTKLYTSYYKDQLKKHYPELLLPPEDVSPKDKFYSLVYQNYGRFPIFSKQPFGDSSGEWLVNGLLFRYFDHKDIPQDEEIYNLNNKLWSIYHDPYSGSLAKYNNLLLSDVLRVYSLSHQEFGYWLARRNYTADAEKHLLLAEKYYPDDLDSYAILAQTYMLQKKCREAEEQVNEMIKRDKDLANAYLLLSLNYSVCFNDSGKASYFREIYEEKIRSKETDLKKL